MGESRILLADDQKEMLETVAQLLQGEFVIVAAVENGKRVIEAVATLDPDVLVLDISMPIMSGLEAATRLKVSGAKAKVIFLTVYEDPDMVEAAFSAGALGYVLKGRIATDLVPAMREVLQDRIFVSPSVRRRKYSQQPPALI